MVWAKIENGRVTGICSTAPPANEAGVYEAGWEQRSENDPAVLAYYKEQNSQPAAPIAADLRSFRLGMLADKGYQRVTLAAAMTTGGMLYVTRLETAFSFDQPHWQTTQFLWTQIIGMLPPTGKPTAIEAANWQAICSSCKLTAIAFDAKGNMVIN